MYDLFMHYLPIVTISGTLLFPPQSFWVRLTILVLSVAFMWATPQYGSGQQSSNQSSYAENYPD